MKTKNLNWIIVLALIMLTGACNNLDKKTDQSFQLGKFGAFYTKISSGKEFERYSRTGDYADIIVDLGREDAKFVFWRGSSYLPYLETEHGKWYVDEIIPRKGNGEGIMPDKINAYSHVKIIESSENEVVVHWRYLPEFSGINPHSGVEATKFVDEYYTINSDWQIKRTVRKGTAKTDFWKDPGNQITQRFKLTEEGITNVETSAEAGHTNPERVVKGSEQISRTVIDPVAWLKFDEGKGDTTIESVAQHAIEIAGHKSLWKKGMSGTALHFDGYNTVLELPDSDAPKLSDMVTLEAWISIGAYPWNWTPVIQKGDESGFYLGISGHGHPGFKIMAGDVWEELDSDFFLERNTWYHLVGTYNGDKGEMKLYVDGNEVTGKKVGREFIVITDHPIKIGKGKNMKPIDPVRENTFIDSYSFDGLIDELKIYDRSLTPDQVKQTFLFYNKNMAQKNNPDMEIRKLPEFHAPGKFGAHYTKLRFYEIWDNLWRFSGHPDVVVTFDELPTQFVFWRGTGYIPMMVNENGQWYSNEFNETWNTSGGQGCQEPMSDKEAYTNHVRIIENTAARTVVHWRYPLLDVLHVFANVNEETGWGDWADWYFYIYPDGVAVKKMHLWTHGERDHEWQESMAIFGPNQHPEDIIETDVALTMVDLDGNLVEYSWEDGPPDNVEKPKDKVIQHINYKADYDPVTIGNFTGSNVYGGELTPYAVFPTWNHWPVAQMPSDGRYASFPDRTAHSSLTHVFLPTFAEDFGDTPYQQKILMEAMLKTSPENLIPLAKSWLNPPALTNLNGCKSKGYDRTQRAFLINATQKNISLMVDASKDHPVINPAFVIKNWISNSPASLAVNGKGMTSGPNVRQGIIRDTDGSWSLIVWFKMEVTEPVEFVFENNTVGNNR